MWIIQLPFTVTGIEVPRPSLVLSGYLASGLLSVRCTCARCGSVYSARAKAGTLSLSSEIECQPSNGAPCKLSFNLTRDGKLLISCDCGPSTNTAPNPFGANDGTSSIVENSRKDD